jgi:hypothetical protein
MKKVFGYYDEGLWRVVNMKDGPAMVVTWWRLESLYPALGVDSWMGGATNMLHVGF